MRKLARGEEEQGQAKRLRLCFLDIAREFEAVGSLELQIKQRGIKRLFSVQRGQRFGGGAGGFDRQPPLLEAMAEDARDADTIFGDEDAFPSELGLGWIATRAGNWRRALRQK